MCNEEKQAHLAVRGVNLYQSKGQDFSEEVNAHFVKQMLQMGAVDQALHVLTKPQHRLGAYMTPKSTDTFLQALAAKPNVPGMVKVLQTLQNKGLFLKSVETATTVLKLVSEAGDAELYDTALVALKIVIHKDAILDVEALGNQFPRPVEEAVSEEGEGDAALDEEKK